MRGRKPKATDLKLLKGTRSDRVKGPQPAPQPGRPEPPERFDEATRAEWGRLCDHLESVGVLNAGHGFALSIYCAAYSRLLVAEKALAEHGPLLVRVAEDGQSVIKSNPAAAMAAKCEATMARILTEFGLTPSSATRTHAEAEAAPDRFAEFLSKKSAR